MNLVMLRTYEQNLLNEILLKRQPSLLSLVDSIGITPLTEEQREALRDVVADELVETGLDDNDEPNDRGLLLEHLIDCLGHL